MSKIITFDIETPGYHVEDKPMSSYLPGGVIIIWSGTISTIPIGWKLCNGTNGTPDLKIKNAYYIMKI